MVKFLWGYSLLMKLKGNVPKEYIPAVEKGFREAMKTGPLAGYQVDSLKVTLLDGSFHPVDSDALSFELAAKMGYKEVAKAAGAVILGANHENWSYYSRRKHG